MPRRKIGKLSTDVKAAGGFRSYARANGIKSPSDWKRYARVRRKNFNEFCLEQQERVFNKLFVPNENDSLNIVDRKRRLHMQKVRQQAFELPDAEFDFENRK